MTTLYIRDVNPAAANDISQRAAALGVSTTTLAAGILEAYQSAAPAERSRIEQIARARQEEKILAMRPQTAAATRAAIAANAAAVLSDEEEAPPAA